jgi:hypothetical protein
MVSFLIEILSNIKKGFGKTFLYEKMEDLITILPFNQTSKSRIIRMKFYD